MEGAVARLLTAARTAGDVRVDVDIDIDDLKPLVVGCQAALRYRDDSGAADRLLDLLHASLAPARDGRG